MFRTKAEHIGTLRMVEVIQTESTKLSAVQYGRLADLLATAETALE